MNSYRYILCVTDLSETSERACARAAALSACFDARLTLLHVVENFPQDRSNEVIAPENVDPREYHESQARIRLDELARGASCAAAEREIRFTTQSAWHEISRFAREEAVDLIVLAGEPQSGVGEAAGHLFAHQTCDILSVLAQHPPR
ncbi:MAG: universal stress protein [Gammaproteobacteria bacterium]